ncbi:PspC domain-containing protein [Nocardia sp. AG03]|uniref:PspC domain-containing protein n=1 Tax=Nocardia sp. AG03 TaxID=3025312 RepID=UPI0024187FC7|nr:PspC domain-containing protein [Nocardia sp. AG03]
MTRASFGDQIQQMWHTRPVRLPQQGPIAGVAAGFGLRYGVDPVLLRVAFVVSTIFGGAGIVLYLLAWLVLSSAGNEASAAQALSEHHSHGSHAQTKTIVLIVALVIAVSTMGPIGFGMGGSGVLSMGLMLAGWWMLYLRHPQLPAGFDAYRSVPPAPYPAAGYPTGAPLGGYPYRPDVATGMYTPYTKLPDTYVPEAAANESAPLLRVEHTETVVLHKDSPTADSETVESPSVATTSAPSDLNIGEEPVTPPGETIDSTPDSTTTPSDTKPSTPPESLSTAADSRPADIADPAEVSEQDRAASGDVPVDLGKRDTEPAQSENPESDGPTTVLRKESPTPRLAAQVPRGWDPLAIAPLAWELPEPAPRGYAPVVPVPPAPKRPRSRLTPVTIGLAILAAAVAGSAAASGAEWMTPARIAAVALAVVGLGLIVGAFLRRGYGLLVLAAPLAGFVLLASLIGPIEFDGATMGERTWAPTSVTELEPSYAVNMGSGTLDLRGMTLTENRSVEVSVNMGEAIVLLPEAMAVRTTCEVRAGDASSCVDGLSGPQIPNAPVLDLKVDVRMGSAEVHRG